MRFRVIFFLHDLLNAFLITLYKALQRVSIRRGSGHVNPLQSGPECLHSTSSRDSCHCQSVTIKLPGFFL
ncbi:hypothetical protein Hanom_Chr04g00322001 [Helianthus anomalus]